MEVKVHNRSMLEEKHYLLLACGYVNTR